MTRISTAIAASLALLAGPAPADCARGTFEGVPYTACTADPARDDIRLWLTDADGTAIATFGRLAAVLSRDGEKLAFAMNGGMYHPDRRPVGHLVIEGDDLAPLVTRAGPGNFGMLPNGVLCLSDGQARIFETGDFADVRPACHHATQSGPLMVQDGALHPRFIPDSSSRFVRNGVGVTGTGQLVMAISDAPVNFHRFARLFRDGLGTPDALYLDGNVSRLHAPDLGRSDPGFPMGPILGVVAAED